MKNLHQYQLKIDRLIKCLSGDKISIAILIKDGQVDQTSGDEISSAISIKDGEADRSSGDEISGVK